MRAVSKLIGLVAVASCTPSHRGAEAQAADVADELRIAVVGAGASGLTAAHTLKELGYQRVTVYEREARVGGKVYSYEYEDYVFELGAFWLGNYETVNALAAHYGITFQPEEAVFVVRDADGVDRSFQSHAFSQYNVFALLWALVNYEWVKFRYTDALNQAGFAGMPEDLMLPTNIFAEKYQIEPIVNLFRPFWVGCGYGYYDTVPALYVLKIMLGFGGGGGGASFFGMFSDTGGGFGLQRIPDGYQSLWEAVAADLEDVRLGHEVTSIVRRLTDSGPVLDVTANGVTETYDRVIISVNPRLALEFLDATEQEEALFSQIQSLRYYLHLVYATDVPYADDTMVFLADKNTSDTIGHMTAFINRGAVPGLWTTGTLVEWETSEAEILAQLEDDFAELGATVDEVVYQQAWNYFPFVTSDVLGDGFYDELEAMQGEAGLYYVGGLMNFETVEHTAAYAKALVEEHF